MITKTDLFEDMAVALDYWVKDSSELLTNSDVDSIYLENAESYNNIRSVLINSGIDSEAIKNSFVRYASRLFNINFIHIRWGYRICRTWKDLLG